MNRSIPLLVLVLLSFGCGPALLTSPAPVATSPAPVQTGEPPLTGFPCEVRDILQTACAGCHVGAVYIPGFAERAELVADGALARFTQRLQLDAAQPMPPQGAQVPLTEVDRSALLGWLAAGAPPGACGPLTP